MQLPNQNLNFIFALLALLSLLFSIYTLWQQRKINSLRKAFFASQTKMDVENLLSTLVSDLKDFRESQRVLNQRLTQLEQHFTFAITKIGLVRFNPFADGGGNFSFSLALLDANNSGLVLTSMYGREQNRIYSKKLSFGKSESQLTQEELQAIEAANIKPKIQNQALIKER